MGPIYTHFCLDGHCSAYFQIPLICMQRNHLSVQGVHSVLYGCPRHSRNQSVNVDLLVQFNPFGLAKR